MKKIIYLFALAVLFTACEKELSLEESVITPPDPKPQPEPVDSFPKFQLTAFYSDIPIDFDETDGVIKKETDLWPYVLDYVKDDHHVITSDTTLEVHQNDIKMPGLQDEVLYKNYQKGADNLGDFLLYLTPDYSQAKYRLYEWTDDHFVIGLKWKDGARVYSRFDRIK